MEYREKERHREKFSDGLTTVVSLLPLCGYVISSASCLVDILITLGIRHPPVLELPLQRTATGVYCLSRIRGCS